MKKIIKLFIGQIVLIISFLCIVGFVYMLYSYSGGTSEPIVFYNEMNIENYKIAIDINTENSKIDDVLRIKVKNIITDEIFIKTETVFENMLIISIFSTISLDIISFISTIIGCITLIIQYVKYKNILRENYVSEENLYELPKYGPIIANVIYNKQYGYESIVTRFKYYYRSIGILNRFDKLKEGVEFDKESLNEIETLVFNSKISGITEFVANLSNTHQREVEKERRIFKELVNKKLIENGFYFEDIVKQKVNAFIGVLKDKDWKNHEKINSNIILKNLLILFGIILGFYVSNILRWAIIIFACWVLAKYYSLSLSTEGNIERAKIYFLIKHLKRKKDLSEEENYFLIMLTK